MVFTGANVLHALGDVKEGVIYLEVEGGGLVLVVEHVPEGDGACGPSFYNERALRFWCDTRAKHWEDVVASVW